MFTRQILPCGNDCEKRPPASLWDAHCVPHALLPWHWKVGGARRARSQLLLPAWAQPRGTSSGVWEMINLYFLVSGAHLVGSAPFGGQVYTRQRSPELGVTNRPAERKPMTRWCLTCANYFSSKPGTSESLASFLRPHPIVVFLLRLWKYSQFTELFLPPSLEITFALWSRQCSCCPF